MPSGTFSVPAVDAPTLWTQGREGGTIFSGWTTRPARTGRERATMGRKEDICVSGCGNGHTIAIAPAAGIPTAGPSLPKEQKGDRLLFRRLSWPSAGAEKGKGDRLVFWLLSWPSAGAEGGFQAQGGGDPANPPRRPQRPARRQAGPQLTHAPAIRGMRIGSLWSVA